MESVYVSHVMIYSICSFRFGGSC